MKIDYSYKGNYLLPNADTSYLDKLFLDENGQLIIHPYEKLKSIPHQELSLFCLKNGFYSIPTQELIDFLKEEIGDQIDKTIEIASGNGVYARALGIKGTDSYMQEESNIKELYLDNGQITVPYGHDVEKIDGLAAVKKYKPSIVLASWCTHKYIPSEHWRGGNVYGVNEKLLFEKVNKYIHIGNENVHNKKPLLKKTPRKIHAEWLLSRAENPKHNVIYIWEK